MRSKYKLGALVLFGMAAASASSHAQGTCEAGAFRSPSGDVLAITTPPTGGFRYTFMDGRRGLVGDPASPVRCAGTEVLVTNSNGGADRWPKIALKLTPTTFDSDGVKLAGLLIEPENTSAPPPLVVMAHGSESWPALPSSVATPFLHAAAGLSIFVFDKHGTGKSGGTFHMNFGRLAKDLVAASAEARRLAAGRFSRFGLHGASQGGWTVPLAAPDAKADFIVISYGGVFSPTEEDAEQVFQDLRVAGFGADVMLKARRLTDATARIVLSDYREGFDELAKLKAEFAGEPWLAKARGEYTGNLVANTDAEIRTWRNQSQIPYDHAAESVIHQNVHVPTLWILAGEDREAPGDLTEERLRRLIREGKPIQVVEFPETDHGMVEYTMAPDGTRTVTRVTDGYYRLAADWIKGRLQPPYGRAHLWPAPRKP